MIHLYTRHSLFRISSVPSIDLFPLGLLSYHINIGGVPVYLGLGILKGSPGRTHLVPLPLHILIHIFHLLVGPSNSFIPGIAVSIFHISVPTISLINLPYKLLGSVPIIFPPPLGRPHPLPKIPPYAQQEIETRL